MRACDPVAYRGKMVVKPGARHSGYRPENYEWLDALCERDERRLIGRDPMTLPLDVLTAAGHPQASVRSVIQRLRVMHGVDVGEARHDGFLGIQPEDFPKRLTAIRETVCMPCSSDNNAEVRRCAICDCPAWHLRLGHNPHNPRRGVNPFAALECHPDAEALKTTTSVEGSA